MIRRKLLYVTCVITLLIVNALYVNYEFFIMLVLILLIPLISWVLYFMSSFGMKINLYNSRAVVTQGDNIKLIIYLIRMIPLPVSRGVLQLHLQYSEDKNTESLDLAMSDPNNEDGTSLVLNTVHCGVYDMSAYRYSWSDYTGIFRSRRKMKGKRSVIVMPKCLQPQCVLYHAQHKDNDYEVLPGSGHESDEVVDIRAYREGDPLNRVHWKLSTRSENIMVRDYDLPNERCNLLLVDLSYMKQPDFRDQLDRIYQAAYSFGYFYADKMIETEFVVWNAQNNKMELIPFRDMESLRTAMISLLKMRCSEDNYLRMVAAIKGNKINLKDVAVLITAQDREESAYPVVNVSQDDIQNALNYMCTA